jgi:hypothetical protein
MFIEYRWTSFDKFTWYLVNTSSFLDIYFVDQFSYSVCVCWFEIKINVVLWSIFSDTVYARVVVFIKDNSFTNIICNIYKKKKELKVSHTSFYHLRLHHFPLKQCFADHLSIFLTKMVRLYARSYLPCEKYVLTDLFFSFVTRLCCFLYTSHVLSVWYFSYLFLSICLL